MDQAILLSLVRTFTLSGAIASTLLGLLLIFFPDFLKSVNDRVSRALRTPSVFSWTVTKPLIWKEPRLSGALLLLVGIPLFVVFFIG